ncbi:DNA starvation/stationary phase protection protein [Bacillaceae bacterium SIJ1]|uniref:Dps family protein n=1 Tax=Litoribacterium kuwaitense TaxID=1398745 RepID=UPI0013EDEF3E|nr:DNA starvation/stationary phase protection protein [Litoribacterium kuwaitense]NGP44219.1 DNA starvation/stationary phase protection protein [Litoribacterium kuwaitense]
MPNNYQSQEASALEQQVNKQLANLHVLYIKLHNYHWYVKGPHFFSLHEKFEEMYNSMKNHIDELAEHMLAIRMKPLASMDEFLREASLQEASGHESAEEMVVSISDDLFALMEESKKVIEGLEEQQEFAIADIFHAMLEEFKKDDWMLRAYLNKE